MRLGHLFLRSRRTGWTLLYLAAVAALSAALHFLLQRGDEDPLAGPNGLPIDLMLVFIPLAAALVIGVGAHGPFGEVERTASWPLPLLRLGHLAGALLWAVAALFLLALTWEGGTQAFMRNLAGFTGLALAVAPLAGARLSWVLPLSYGGLAYWMGATTPGEQEPGLWLWPMRAGDDGMSIVIATALLASGLAIAALVGARDSRGETE